MEPKDIAQLLVSGIAPFIAAGAALFIAALQQRERVSIVVTNDYDYQYDEMSLLVIHNRSAQPIAVTSVRYLSGVLWRRAERGTALWYDDPTDLGFPYLVAPGELRRLRLSDHQAGQLAATASKVQWWIALLLRRPRFVIECRTTAGARYRTSGEAVLPWDAQASWMQGASERVGRFCRMSRH